MCHALENLTELLCTCNRQCWWYQLRHTNVGCVYIKKLWVYYWIYYFWHFSMDHCLQKHFLSFICFCTVKLYYVSCICIGLNHLNLAKTLDFVQLAGGNLFLLYIQIHEKSWKTGCGKSAACLLSVSQEEHHVTGLCNSLVPKPLQCWRHELQVS